MAGLGFPSLISRTVSVDVKHHVYLQGMENEARMCENGEFGRFCTAIDNPLIFPPAVGRGDPCDVDPTHLTNSHFEIVRTSCFAERVVLV